MVVDEDFEYIFHNDAITRFNEILYSNIFTRENIVSPKKAFRFGDRKMYGYVLEKGLTRYFMDESYTDLLPFKIKESMEVDYKNDVYTLITGAETIKIPAEKRMTFRELINSTPSFTHTNPLHFLLYKIVSVTGYIDRINARISTAPGFGKDCMISILSNLVNSTYNLYGATFPKLEYGLTNKLIVLNELGNLNKEEKIDMQEFLLATGAYFNNYIKRSRKTNTTQEQYDISKLSLLIFYNLPEHYISKGQEYFDLMFTKAVINRFIPFVFEGVLSTRFDKLINVGNIVNKYSDIYKKVIATLNYYRQNTLIDIKYKVDREVIKFSDSLMRYDRTMNTILKYVAEYSESQEEFDSLSKELYKCYLDYDKLITKEAQHIQDMNFYIK